MEFLGREFKRNNVSIRNFAHFNQIEKSNNGFGIIEPNSIEPLNPTSEEKGTRDLEKPQVESEEEENAISQAVEEVEKPIPDCGKNQVDCNQAEDESAELNVNDTFISY